MNLFKIDFIQGKTDAVDYGTVVHSLTDADGDRKIMTLTLSADKLQGVSKYSREPKRLNFECFVDAWIEQYILCGDYEHERCISHYEVRAYRDNVQIFRGIIDTSGLSYDQAEGIISFLCYDKIKLLSVYSDLNMLYALSAGYQPWQILGLFIQKIERRIPIDIPYSAAGLTMPSITVDADEYSEMVELDKSDLTEMNTLPTDADGWEYSWLGSWTTPLFGFVRDSLSNKVYFLAANYQVIQARYDEGGGNYIYKYKARCYGKINTIFNKTAIVSAEYYDESDWQDEQFTGDDDAIQRRNKFFTDRGFDLAEYGDWDPITSLTGTNYACFYGSNIIHSYFYGEVIPSKYQPGEFYIGSSESANCLKVLQAILLICNATLVAQTNGTIVMLSKADASDIPIVIANNDVVSLPVQRLNPEVPDTTVIEIMIGDTAILQSYVKEYMMNYFASKWQANITIDRIDQYNIVLGSLVEIGDNQYTAVEVQKDWVADDYKIKAWKI